MIRPGSLWFAFLVVALTACSSLSNTTSSIGPIVAANDSSGQERVRVSIVLPVRNNVAHGRKAAYVSPFIQSFSVSVSRFGLVASGSPPPSPAPSPTPTYNYVLYSSSQIDCSSTTCSAALSIPDGFYRFDFTFFDGKGGTGHAIQSATVYPSIAPGAANLVAVTLNPDIASVALLPVGAATPANGIPSTIQTIIEFLDAGGHIVPANLLPTYLYFRVTGPPSPSPFSISPSGVSTTDIAAGKTIAIAYDGSPQIKATNSVFSIDASNLNFAPTVDGKLATLAPFSIVFGDIAPFSPVANPGAFSPFASIGNSLEGGVASGANDAILAIGSLNESTNISPTTIPSGAITVEARSGSQAFSTSRRAFGQRGGLSVVSGDAFFGAPDVVPDLNLKKATRLPRMASRKIASYGLPPVLGTKSIFSVLIFPIDGSAAGSSIDVPFTLKASGPHELLWVDDTIALSDSELQSQIASFDTAYASDTAVFGSLYYDANSAGNFTTQACDVNGNVIGTTPYWSIISRPDVVDLLVVSPTHLGAGVGGYFAGGEMASQAAQNCFPSMFVFHSTNAPTIVLGNFGVGFAEGGFSHELQHLIHFVNHQIVYDGSTDPSYIDEGMAVNASSIAAGDRPTGQPGRTYVTETQYTSLLLWRGTDRGHTGSGCGGCYDGGGMFVRYLIDRFGVGVLQRLTQTPTYGFGNIAQAASLADGSSVVADFYATLAVAGKPANADPRYSFPNFTLPAASIAATVMVDGGPVTIPTVNQGGVVFVTVKGSKQATVRIDDSSGLLRLTAIGIRP